VVLHHLRAVWWSVSRATRQTVRVAVEPNIGLLLKWRFQIRRQDRTVVKRDLEVWLGEPYPLGATLTEEGVNFALYSEDATAVELYGLRTGSAMLMQATLESKKSRDGQ
jgi:hypothetical protein